MLVSDFDFPLPDELVAQEPGPRGASRMLVMRRATGVLEHAGVADLPRLLTAGDLLVVNNSRVFAARLLGRRVPSGGAVECLLLSWPASRPDGSLECDALMHPGQKLKPGALVQIGEGERTLTCEILERKFFGRRRVRLTATGPETAESLIERLGHVPLPPYIRRGDTVEDRDRYQTVFASARGSVAAPTAGLHFSPAMLEMLAARGIEQVAVTLHVGYGTFKPVRTETVEGHTVDPESYEIDSAAAARVNAARDEGRRVIAVGTTTTRALEDAALRGGGRIAAGREAATTFIYPGFQFRAIDGLMTNFHLPRSSLLMLVCAFAGRERTLAAYKEAVAHRYRFYSYGDAMLIL